FAAADDQLARGLAGLPRSIAERGLAPRRLGVASGSGLALATAVRMVAGVHRRTADLGTLAQPAAAARLAAGLVLVLDVTDLADRGLAADVNPAQLPTRHPDHGVIALFREQLGAGAGGAHQLATATERELQVVHRRADGDVLQGDRVTDPHRGVGAGL